MKSANYHWIVTPCLELGTITIDQQYEGEEESILIDVTQQAALVKAIGLAADEIYRQRKE